MFLNFILLFTENLVAFVKNNNVGSKYCFFVFIYFIIFFEENVLSMNDIYMYVLNISYVLI